MSELPPQPESVENPGISGIEQTLKVAMAHQGRGEYARAERLYREVLAVEPDQPIALHLLGVLAHMAGQSEMALELIRAAIHHAPDYVAAHNNLGNVLRDLGNLEAAGSAYQRAIALKADYAEAIGNLGLVQAGQNEAVAAEAS